MDTLEQEIVNAVILLHGKRAVSALSFSTSEAIASLKQEEEGLKREDPNFNPESAANQLSSYPGLYERYAKIIAEYIHQNFPGFATTRCFPGDLLPRRQSIYDFIDTLGQANKTPAPSAQPPSPALP